MNTAAFITVWNMCKCGLVGEKGEINDEKFLRSVSNGQTASQRCGGPEANAAPSRFIAWRHFLLTFNCFADSRMSRTRQAEELRSITALTGFSVLLNSAPLSPKLCGLFADASELPDEELPLVCVSG